MNDSLTTLFFDIDGTLIDSNSQHAAAWIEALSADGIKADPVAVRKAIGMGGDHLLPQLFAIESDSPRGKRISEKRGEIFRTKYLPQLQETPGATALLSELQRRNFRLAIVTSASEKDAQLLLKQCNLDNYFAGSMTGSDVENSKPDADIVVAALKRFAIEPKNAVMVGDTSYDIRAARGAGLKTIAFTCGGSNAEELLGAIEIFAFPEELLENLDTTLAQL